MENRCYNCAKGMSPYRTCIADGDCPDFDPGASEREVKLVFDRLQTDMPWLRFEMAKDSDGEPVIRIENAE